MKRIPILGVFKMLNRVELLNKYIDENHEGIRSCYTFGGRKATFTKEAFETLTGCKFEGKMIEPQFLRFPNGTKQDLSECGSLFPFSLLGYLVFDCELGCSIPNANGRQNIAGNAELFVQELEDLIWEGLGSWAEKQGM